MIKNALFIVLLTLGCNNMDTGNNPKSDKDKTSISEQACSYVDQKPDDFGNLKQICSIRYPKNPNLALTILRLNQHLLAAI